MIQPGSSRTRILATCFGGMTVASKMKSFFPSWSLIDTLNRLKVNWSKENKNEALLSKWPKIDGYPHLFVLDADGRLVHSQDTAKFYRWREREYPKMFPDGKYPPNTLLIIDRLVQEQFLIEIQTVAVV